MDPEGQIYDNVAWDLPGFRRQPQSTQKSTNRQGGRVAAVVGD
jgi:hypothetical protein